MATTLIVRGAQIELSDEESFTKVKHRIKKAKQRRVDYENGTTEEFSKGEDEIEFYTDMGDGETGRVFFDTNDTFGCMSDKRSDKE